MVPCRVAVSATGGKRMSTLQGSNPEPWALPLEKTNSAVPEPVL